MLRSTMVALVILCSLAIYENGKRVLRLEESDEQLKQQVPIDVDKSFRNVA